MHEPLPSVPSESAELPREAIVNNVPQGAKGFVVPDVAPVEPPSYGYDLPPETVVVEPPAYYYDSAGPLQEYQEFGWGTPSAFESLSFSEYVTLGVLSLFAFLFFWKVLRAKFDLPPTRGLVVGCCAPIAINPVILIAEWAGWMKTLDTETASLVDLAQNLSILYLLAFLAAIFSAEEERDEMEDGPELADQSAAPDAIRQLLGSISNHAKELPNEYGVKLKTLCEDVEKLFNRSNLSELQEQNQVPCQEIYEQKLKVVEKIALSLPGLIGNETCQEDLSGIMNDLNVYHEEVLSHLRNSDTQMAGTTRALAALLNQ